MGGLVWDEKTRIRLSLAQVQMKLAAGAELGSSSILVMQTMTEHSSYLTRANMIMDSIQCE